MNINIELRFTSSCILVHDFNGLIFWPNQENAFLTLFVGG